MNVSTVPLLVSTLSLLTIPTTRAYDLPAVNLGLTSFLDGGPPAGPGFYFTQYGQYYHADRFHDANGDRIPLPDPEVDVFVSLSQFIYQFDHQPLLGAKFGLDAIVPLVFLNASYGASGPFPEDNGNGLGDILVGPFLQWDPIMGQNGPLFVHRIEFQMIFPTGKYDSNRELNPGSKFFSFNPYWAGTLFLTPRWTASVRAHYLWNDENNQPNRAFGDVDTVQAGQALHANLSTAYEVIPKRLRLGLNSYYLKQITDTRVDGSTTPDRKEQVLGFGPGLLYHFSGNDHLFFNAYWETLAENRTQGVRLNLRWVHHF